MDEARVVGPLVLIIVGLLGLWGGLSSSLPITLLSLAGIAGGVFWFLKDRNTRLREGEKNDRKVR